MHDSFFLQLCRNDDLCLRRSSRHQKNGGENSVNVRNGFLYCNLNKLLRTDYSNQAAVKGRLYRWSCAISSLSLAFLFDKSKLGKTARAFCLCNSAIMLLGIAGYIINNFILLLLTMNLGLGASSIGIIICSALYFKRSKRLKA